MIYGCAEVLLMIGLLHNKKDHSVLYTVIRMLTALYLRRYDVLLAVRYVSSYRHKKTA